MTKAPPRRFPALRLSALALALSLPIAVQAQDGPQPDPADAVTLDALEVTAQRRVENIQDVPVSISVLSGETLDVLGSGGTDVRFLSGRVPSLNIESSFGRAFPRFYIRGYGNTDFRLNTSQPVSLVYDDVVQENPISSPAKNTGTMNVVMKAGTDQADERIAIFHGPTPPEERERIRDAFNSGGGSDELCDFSAFGSCIAVMTD